jgi:hypothetical protein
MPRALTLVLLAVAKVPINAKENEHDAEQVIDQQ